MSEYLEFKTQITRKDELVLALGDMGFTTKQIEVHADPQTLYGWHGEKRPEKSEVIIRRQHVGGAANDLGFTKQPDGTYKAIISANERTCGYNAAWLDRLNQNYMAHVIRKKAKVKGYRVTEEKIGGKIQMTLRK
jgi:hypothetical protein